MKHYSDHTTEEVFASLSNNRILLPIGTIEQHGPHLPLSVDIDIPTAIVEELSHKHCGIIAPGIIYGARSQPHSGGGPSYPGTIYVKGTVLTEYFGDIIKSYASAGAKEIVIVNGHYENEPFIFEALEICRENGYLKSTKIIALSWWSMVSDKLISVLTKSEFLGWHAEHAGFVETCLMMYLKPELVRTTRVDHLSPPLPGTYIHPIDPVKTSTRGVLTKTSGASSLIGKALFEHICNTLLVLIEEKTQSTMAIVG